MSSRLVVGASAALATALAAGTFADRPVRRPLPALGGYVVVAADFHVHSFPGTWSTPVAVGYGERSTPPGARRHCHDAAQRRLGRQARTLVGVADRRADRAPGEEITTPGYHLLAVNNHDYVARDPSPARVVEAIHRQGGIAIAAHPYENTWPAYDAESLRALDGAEIVRPESQQNAHLAWQLREFASRGTFAAIGASDFHGLGTLGYSRTYVFARERSAGAIVDAIRARRTVVYDRDRAHGDPELIALVAQVGGLPHDVPGLPKPSAAAAFSRIAGALALIVLLLFNRW
jgi:PHP domain-containing protein